MTLLRNFAAAFLLLLFASSLQASTLAAGSAHTCTIATGGGVQCWGSNSYGQLGNGTTIDSPMPVNVSGLASGVSALAAGDVHTCALTNSGGVQCWGPNDSG